MLTLGKQINKTREVKITEILFVADYDRYKTGTIVLIDGRMFLVEGLEENEIIELSHSPINPFQHLYRNECKIGILTSSEGGER